MATDEIEDSGGRPVEQPDPDKSDIVFFEKQLDNLYDSKDEGSYLVMIERFDRENCKSDSRSVSELAFGKKRSEVLGETIHDAFDLKKPGNFKFSLKFPDAEKANNFVVEFNKKNILDNQKWKAYIPNFRIYYTVILDVLDGDSTDEKDILANLKASSANAPNWSLPNFG